MAKRRRKRRARRRWLSSRQVINGVVKVAVVAMLLAFVYALIQQSMTPPEVRELQAQQQMARMRTMHQVTVVVAWAAGIALAVAMIGGATWVLVKVRNLAQYVYAKNGLFPIRMWRTGPDQITTVNPNMMALPAGTVRVLEDGATSLYTGADGFSHEQLMALHGGQQRIQRLQAGGRERARGKWEVVNDAGMLSDFAPQRRQLPVPEEEPETVPAQRMLSVSDALDQSNTDSFLLGQSERGDLCRVNLRTDVHIAILGATGCGKTASTGYQLALAALANGYRVVILDPKGGMDWGPFARVCEWHESDSHVITEQMHHVYSEFERRMVVAQRHGVRHVAQLDDPDMAPLLVIVEEYGDLCAGMKRNTRDQIDGWIDSMARLGRATDVHIAFIDQYPEHWSQQVMLATKRKIVYRASASLAGKVSDYDTQHLPPVGWFRCDRETYQAWHVEPDLPNLLPAVGRAAKRYPALIDGTYSVVDRGNSTGNRQETKETGNSRGNSTGNTLPERKQGVSSVSTVSRGGVSGRVDTPTPTPGNSGNTDDERGLTETQIKVWRHMKKHPDMGVRERAELLGVSPGYVSKLYKRRSELGGN